MSPPTHRLFIHSFTHEMPCGAPPIMLGFQQYARHAAVPKPQYSMPLWGLQSTVGRKGTDIKVHTNTCKVTAMLNASKGSGT